METQSPELPLVEANPRKDALQKQKKAASIYLACGVVNTLTAIGYFTLSIMPFVSNDTESNSADTNNVDKFEKSAYGRDGNLASASLALATSLFTTGMAAHELHTAKVGLAQLN